VIFVDTSYRVAQANERDRHHADAIALLADHGDAGLVTSNHVRGATWAYLRRRAGHRHAPPSSMPSSAPHACVW
jgi:predicted nucleic acid-binding protein